MTQDDVTMLREMFHQAERRRRHRQVGSFVGWVAASIVVFAAFSLIW